MIYDCGLKIWWLQYRNLHDASVYFRFEFMILHLFFTQSRLNLIDDLLIPWYFFLKNLLHYSVIFEIWRGGGFVCWLSFICQNLDHIFEDIILVAEGEIILYTWKIKSFHTSTYACFLLTCECIYVGYICRWIDRYLSITENNCWVAPLSPIKCFSSFPLLLKYL